MRRGFRFALILAGILAAGSQAHAQVPTGSSAPASGQTKPAGQQPAKPVESNPFPEDTNSVPVLPAKTAPPLPDGNYGSAESVPSYEGMKLPGDDSDPVRSPDDPVAAPSAADSSSSSSLAGLDKVLPGPDDDKVEQKRKLAVKEPKPKEVASKDIEVGGYYLETKNWKAAESRFESAMVLDPDNPDVFWGLAEAERHLGNFADARKHYQTVVDYDPDSKHGKDARKALKEPEIANAKPPAVGQTLAGGSQK